MPGFGCRCSQVPTQSFGLRRVLQLQGTPNTTTAYLAQVTVDGTVIPLQPDDAWKSGNFNKMPIMTGDVHDEGNFTVGINEYFSSPRAAMTQDQYLAKVTGAALNEYPLANYGNNASLAYNPYGSDPQHCLTLRVVKENWPSWCRSTLTSLTTRRRRTTSLRCPVRPLATHTSADRVPCFPAITAGYLA